MPGTDTEAQKQLMASVPQTDPGAVTCTNKATFYMVGLSNGPGSSDLEGAVNPQSTTLVVASATSFYQGEWIIVSPGTANAELAVITAISGTTFTVQSVDGGPLFRQHLDTENVIGTFCAFQPQFSGRALVIIQGSLTSNTTGDTVEAQISYSDASLLDGAPASGDASEGTLVGNIATVVALTGVLTQPFVCVAAIGTPGASGTLPSPVAALTVGKPYWIDLAVNDLTSAGKTVQPQFLSCTVVEL